MRPASTNIKTDGSVSVWGCCMSNMRRYRPHDPSPSVAEPRRPLLLGAYSFVRAARLCPGVRRIALLGSLATAKAIPKDVDLLVTVERAMDLSQLARAGRRLKGSAQTINLGADIFLADRGALPWSYLRLSRMPCTCRVQCTALRASSASQRRSPCRNTV